MDRSKLYTPLFEAYVEEYPTKSKKLCQQEVNEKWNAIKDSEELIVNMDGLLNELKAITMKHKGGLLSFWGKQPTQKAVPTMKSSVPEITIVEVVVAGVSDEAGKNGSVPGTSANSSSCNSVKQKAIVQDELQLKINVINADLVGLYARKTAGILTDLQETELSDKKRKVVELGSMLKGKKGDQRRAKKFRDDRKKRLAAACAKNPELKSTLKIRNEAGRPRLEDDQPLLLQAILDIAFYGSAAHEKRQSDVYRSIKTLDKLTKQLNNNGFNIHRGEVYLRLIPKRSFSLEGKRHITTVPVKLIRAQNDSHAKHVDQKFCLSTIKHLEEISSTLGPNEVCFLSQDGKARVPIGLTAANKQSPLLMHVEYRVSLPDHDWVVAAQHKLIPSVYAGIVVQPNGLGKPEAVSYSGPTYIAIRSGKHSSSSAYAHALDFERLLQLPEFDTITKYGPDKVVKPVIVITVDGGPDENPRYQKVIEMAVHQKNLDAYFIATNAPGRSAFNRVERRMAPLSRELSSLILPHDKYGSHLNDRGLTIDTNLEKKNFSFAGSTLAEIWSQTVVDGHPIVAEYIDPELKPESLQSKDPIWFAAHVRTSQYYFTQIVKCNNTCCCSKPRSSYFTFMPERFVAPPIPIVQTPLDGLKAPEKKVHEENHRPFSIFVCVKVSKS